MTYPKVLVLTSGRINAADTANNGLLLRNLFGAWPKEKLAQIYSSGDNGDKGFFGSYYQLGPQDRQLGGLFYSLKTEATNPKIIQTQQIDSGICNKGTLVKLKSLAKRQLVNTGLYELIFRPRISQEMQLWIDEFKPNLIFSQGYSLTFAWLPVMLYTKLKLPLVYYPTDDWPVDLYRNNKSRLNLFSFLVRCLVTRASMKMVDVASLRIAFNYFMQQEYLERYGRSFEVLMHGDILARFQMNQPMKALAKQKYRVVSTGVFDEHRYPLLNDIDKACQILQERGWQVSVVIYPVNSLSELVTTNNSFKYLEFRPCPSHEDLAWILTDADILWLPERFDETAEDISLCISSKAHLFMFSGRPIIVYSDKKTGISRYAEREDWATVINQQDPLLLANAVERLISDVGYREYILENAHKTLKKNHDLSLIQASFLKLLKAINYA